MGFGKQPLSRVLDFAQTLVLVGCFTIFWTVYYMLEVYLSQRSVAASSACGRGPCHWPHRSRKANEEGTELESVPLCRSKDLGGVETESGDPPAGPGLLVPDPLVQSSKSAPDCPPDLLQPREEQIC